MPVIQQGISVAVDNILLATDFSQASENAAAYAKATAAMVENLMHPDTAEGIAAFLEKRSPN